MGLFSNTENKGEQFTTFTWKRNKWLAWQLTFFIIFSLLLHGASFYLFKVDYPNPVRVEPEPSHITVLDDANPSVRQILQRVQDRTVYLRSPSEASPVRQKLSDHYVRFAPSFESIGPRFLPPDESAPKLSDLFQISELSPAESQKMIEIELSPSLSERAIAPWSILADYLEGAGELPDFQANVSVLPDGTVFNVTIGVEFDPEIGKEVAKVIESTLRFTPLESDAARMAEGWVRVHQRGQ